MILYKNPINTQGSFVYSTNYDCKIHEPVERILTVDTTNSDNAVKIYVFGVPDGVSPYVNEAMIPDNVVRRLYIFSNKALSLDDQKLIASYYKGTLYEPTVLDTPVFQLDFTKNQRPAFNFYIMDDRLIGDKSTFMEYRYFSKRTQPANVLLDIRSGDVYQFVLPDTVPCLITIIMPDNFAVHPNQKRAVVETSPGILIHLFSRHFMISPNKMITRRVDGYELNTVTDARILDTVHLLSYVKDCFARMGFLNVYGASVRQCVAYDSYCTAVIGEYSDVNV